MFAGLCSRLGLDLVQTPIPFENFRSPLGWDGITWWQRRSPASFNLRGVPGWLVE